MFSSKKPKQIVSLPFAYLYPSLSDINPHPLVVKLEYSHPTLSQRIDNIYAHSGDKQNG